MYLAIDIGGSKTLLAVFSETGELVKKHKFPTDSDYARFLGHLEDVISTEFADYAFRSCCCAPPGLIDPKRGIVKHFGNLKWANLPLKEDVKRLLGGTAVFMQNDAKLAGLSEALLLHKKYNKVLYLTIGTGIGDGIIIDGKIDPELSDSEAGQMVIEHDGELVRWEDIASGRAIVKRFGKKAADIDDPGVWKEYVKALAKGLDPLFAVIQPDVLIIGGGVGTHYEKFGKLLEQELTKYENDMVKIPPILKAKRPEEAVIYGCYDYIKQNP